VRLYLAANRDGQTLQIAAAALRGNPNVKLYLADTNATHLHNGFKGARAPFPVLLSYFYFRDRDMIAVLDKIFETHVGIDLFADSGAFSAHSLGQPLRVEAYAEWLNKWKHLFTVYANLDVKGDVDAGLKNQRYLESQGLSPLPVFHGGEPLSVLEDLIQEYPYIALGGLAGETRSGSREMWAFVIKCFKMAKGRAVFHGFGMTNWKLMSSLPWYSCDSSSWGQGFRFGAVPLFVPLLGKFDKVKVGDHASSKKHARVIRAYGFDPQDFLDRTRYHSRFAAGLSAASYCAAARYLTKRHGEITIPKRETKR